MKKMVKSKDEHGIARTEEVHMEKKDGVSVYRSGVGYATIAWDDIIEIFEQMEGRCNNCNGYGKIMGCSSCGKTLLDNIF